MNIRLFVQNISAPTNSFRFLFTQTFAKRIYSDICSANNKIFADHQKYVQWSVQVLSFICISPWVASFPYSFILIGVKATYFDKYYKELCLFSEHYESGASYTSQTFWPLLMELSSFISSSLYYLHLLFFKEFVLEPCNCFVWPYLGPIRWQMVLTLMWN